MFRPQESPFWVRISLRTAPDGPNIFMYFYFHSTLEVIWHAYGSHLRLNAALQQGRLCPHGGQQDLMFNLGHHERHLGALA